MKVNNVNLEAVAEFIEQVRADPDAARKTTRIEAYWGYCQAGPQFSATLEHEQGDSTLDADSTSFMGGEGRAPHPIQYCLYGLASCFGSTFAALAAADGVTIRDLMVVAENRVDLSRSIGLSDKPVVEQVSLTLQVDTDADEQKVTELERMARERCPGIHFLTNPIHLETRVETARQTAIN